MGNGANKAIVTTTLLRYTGQLSHQREFLFASFATYSIANSSFESLKCREQRGVRLISAQSSQLQKSQGGTTTAAIQTMKKTSW